MNFRTVIKKLDYFSRPFNVPETLRTFILLSESSNAALTSTKYFLLTDKIIFDDRVINPTIVLDALPISDNQLMALGIVENSPHNKIMALMKFIS